MRAIDLFKCGLALADLHRSQWRTQEVLRKQQRRALITQAAFAARHVSAYRERSGSWEMLPRIQRIEDLAHLPLLRRDQIQANPDAFLADTGNRASWYESHTSGSLGKPLQTWFDPACWWQVKYAVKARWLLAAGYRPWHRVAIVDDVPASRLAKHTAQMALWGEGALKSRLYLSVFDDPERHLASYLSFRPHMIYCFPLLFRAAVAILERNAPAQSPGASTHHKRRNIDKRAALQIRRIIRHSGNRCLRQHRI